MPYTGETTPKLLLNKPDSGAREWTDEGNFNWDQIEARLATSSAGDPNGNVEGLYLGQYCWDLSTGIMSACTVVGAAGVSVWVPIAVIMDLSGLSVGDGLIWNGTALVAGPLQGSSLGDFKASGASAIAGWLPCDGWSVSRTTYANLFAVIGTNYGAGNGSTTFNVPDFRGRSVLGANNAAFGRGETPNRSTRNLGDAGGDEDTLGLLAHTHKMTVNTDENNSSPVLGISEQVAALNTPSGEAKGYVLNGSAAAATHGNTGSAGSGGAETNMMPFQVANWFVYHGVV